MSASRESFLVESLKHVSLQRLRKLKMEMDKMARDSRINSDLAFWKLLEMHQINLDERTKLDFYKRVSDNKGVDTEAAIKYLRSAQRKTGRDSVEVLQKPLDSLLSTKEIGKTPAATPFEAVVVPPLKLPLPTSTANLKLEKIRNKIRALGKLKLAMKNAAEANSSASDGSSKVLKDSSTNEKTIKRKQETGQQEENYESKPTNESEKSEERESSSASVEKGSLLKLILKTNNSVQEENSAVNDSPDNNKTSEEDCEKDNEILKQTPPGDSKTVTKPSSCSEKEDDESCESSKMNVDNQQLSSGNKSHPVQDEANISEDNSKLSLQSSSAKQAKEISESSNSPEEAETEEEPKKDQKIEAISEDYQQVENIESSSVSDGLKVTSNGTSQSSSNKTENNILEENKSCSNEDIQPSNNVFSEKNNEDTKSTHEEFEKSSHGTNTSNKRSEPSMSSSSDHESESFSTTPEEEQEKFSETEQSEKPKPSDSETEQIQTTEKPASEETSSKSSSCDHLNEEEKEELEENITDTQRRKTQDELSVHFSINLNPKEEANSEDDNVFHPVLDENTNSDAKEFLKEKKIKKELKVALSDEKPITDHDINSERAKSTTVQQSDEATELLKSSPFAKAGRKSAKKRKFFEVQKQDKENRSDQTTSTDSTKPREGIDSSYIPDTKTAEKADTAPNTESFSDTCSVTTESSTDNDFESSENVKAFGPIVSEKVNICGTDYELIAPSWLNPKKIQNQDIRLPELYVNWTYGCDTTHQSCIASTKQGELLYFSGCVAVVYDHVRATQRCYLEHTAPIISITSHHDDDLVATAQFEKASVHGADSGRNLQELPHIRVWNHIRLETIRIIGLGILKYPVFKMTFLNFQDYFVTIEEDEDSTMTVWDGGCRVNSKSSAFVEPVVEKVKEEMKPARKKFVPTRPRSVYQPQQTKAQKPLQEKNHAPAKPNTGSRCVSGNLTEVGWYVTGGKRELSFWELQDRDANDDIETNYKISQPTFGDFGKKFFRAEYITTCTASRRYLDGCVLTGDSNGTVLMWSEKSKTAVSGFPHAHECAVKIICFCDEGFIFTAGSRDRLIKAFQPRKAKFDCLGRIEIPKSLGSATCLACSDKTLFVGTEKNAILSVDFGFNSNSSVFSSFQTNLAASHSLGRSVSSNPLLSKRSSPNSTSIHPNEEDSENATEFFSLWDENEVARGFGKGTVCVCPMKQLHEKQRSRKVENPNTKLPGMPSSDECISILQRQMAKSARQRHDISGQEVPKPTIYAWKTPEPGERKIIRKPAPSILSPRLRTNERMLFKEKVIEACQMKSLPGFALTSHIKKEAVFQTNLVEQSIKKELFLASSEDGWLFIFDATQHQICGRHKLATTGHVTSISACSRRHLVAVGTSCGSLLVSRINPDGFETFPNVKCRKVKTIPKVKTLKFSPSGSQLAVSVGSCIIVYSVHRAELAELGRYLGHSSTQIVSINWSRKKSAGSYLIRTCSIDPVSNGIRSRQRNYWKMRRRLSIRKVVELKVWRVDKFCEVSEKDSSRDVVWDSSSFVDYCVKGIWNHNVCTSRISSICVFDEVSGSGDVHKQFETLQNDSADKFMIIGDSSGSMHLHRYPCLQWINRESVRLRSHSSSICLIERTANGSHIFATSIFDTNVVQWSIKNE